MHLEGSHWVRCLETASEGDEISRGNVGSGDLADRKTTARTQTCVSGSLRYPLDAAVAAGGRPGGLGGGGALGWLPSKEVVPEPSLPG